MATLSVPTTSAPVDPTVTVILFSWPRAIGGPCNVVSNPRTTPQPILETSNRPDFLRIGILPNSQRFASLSREILVPNCLGKHDYLCLPEKVRSVPPIRLGGQDATLFSANRH